MYTWPWNSLIRLTRSTRLQNPESRLSIEPHEKGIMPRFGA